ncbi:aldehyde dehydrogenase (NADP(+)) [Actinomadura sp. 9N407]|uniref:aldehyde dehydrogenase (NADP(+)) n=1 Tax=Actinomadura sp. 9N407 TaxID=3375154 RepID=UPI003787C1EF
MSGPETALHAVDPRTGERLEPGYEAAGPQDVDGACELAWQAFGTYRRTGLKARAAFLDTIADRIEALGDVLVERVVAETGIPRARVEGERARTCNQLRLFAQVVRSGDWLGARIDPALPERTPLPRPDLRRRQVPLGPVAVFGASNFPLAFSVAGGDTASALAAGAPVVVKAHPAHPGTSELVGRAVREAVQEHGLPEGTFSLLHGAGHEIGTRLVTHPRIAAVGFTGSRRGGLALVAAAAARPVPIPVYAEMSSVNPVFLLPGALRDGGADLGRAFVASLSIGAGQLCTSPGLVFLVGDGSDAFIEAASAAVAAAPPAPMLTAGIRTAYDAGTARLAGTDGVRTLARGLDDPEIASPCVAGLFLTDDATFLAHSFLQDEVFGASSLLVRVADADRLAEIIGSLEGQLTATVHAAPGDHALAGELLPALETLAGRVLFNGWPTGVEVGDAIVHGGPFPATSAPATTSVGTSAIERFLRPVSYQNVPDGLLPEELRDGDPLGVPRRVDGKPV